MKIPISLMAFLATALLLFSCKKDKQDYIIPAEKRYLASVSDKTGKTIVKLTYYEDKKIKTFTSGSWEYRYIYDNNGRVSSVFAGTEECQYSYNSSGRIINFTVDGQTIPVSYNSVENKYSFTSFLDQMHVFLDTKGNCTKIIYGNTNSLTTANFFYQNNHRGPLSNGGDMSLTNFISSVPMFLLGQAEGNVLALPLDGYSGSNNESSASVSFSNEYDSENFLQKSTITTTRRTGNNSETDTAQLTYHYIEL